MNNDRHNYAHGTFIVSRYPFGLYMTGAAECSDGKVRRLKRIASTADTFFSVPASVRVDGKTVAGYVTTEAVSGSSVVTNDDPAIIRFIAYSYRKNGALLPGFRNV